MIGLSRYNELKSMFEDNRWTIKNYLEFYNNLDVKPFLVALENLSGYCKERGVDVFKEALSGKIFENYFFNSKCLYNMHTTSSDV